MPYASALYTPRPPIFATLFRRAFDMLSLFLLLFYVYFLLLLFCRCRFLPWMRCYYFLLLTPFFFFFFGAAAADAANSHQHRPGQPVFAFRVILMFFHYFSLCFVLPRYLLMPMRFIADAVSPYMLLC